MGETRWFNLMAEERAPFELCTALLHMHSYHLAGIRLSAIARTRKMSR